MDVDARIQLFDLKTKYQFQTQPGIDQYNMPYYSIQTEPGPQNISYYPVYQGFTGPATINGVSVSFYTQRELFYNTWPNYTQTLVQVETGSGARGPYTFGIPFLPNTPSFLNFPVTSGIVRGHVDITGVISTGTNPLIDPPIVTSAANYIETIPTTSVYSAVYFTSQGTDGSNIVICDSGQFLQGDVNYGLLMKPGPAPFGNEHLAGATDNPLTNYSTIQNTINYFTGVAENVYFPTAIPDGMPINAQCFYFQLGLPRGILFYNNIITLRVPPATQYLVELDAYLSPAAYLSQSQAIQFAYMSEYIARGAARKIMSDTGDMEQLQFYEPFFREQEILVWKRSQRQWTSTRTQTIYSQGQGYGGNNYGTGVY